MRSTSFYQSLSDYAIAHPSVVTTPPGYAELPVHWRLDIKTNGGSISATMFDLAPADDKGKRKPTPMDLPSTTRSTNIRPNLVADTADYVFGLFDPTEAEKSDDKREKVTRRAVEKRESYLDMLGWCIDELAMPEIRALLDVVTDPARFMELPEGLLHSDRIDVRIDGKRPTDDPRVVAAAEQTLSGDIMDACSVCGSFGPVIAQIPAIKGVPNTQGAGARMASANSTAMEHYGRHKKENVSICVPCASRSHAALNYLLRRDESHLRVGDETVFVWWSVTAPRQADDLFGALLQPGSDTHKDFLLAPYRGGGQGSLGDTEFALLGLKGKQGRIAVTHFSVGQGSELAGRVQRWIDATTVSVGDGGTRQVSINSLADAVNRYAVGARPGTGGTPDKPFSRDAGDRLKSDLITTAYLGYPLPRYVASSVVRRICAEGAMNQAQATLLSLTRRYANPDQEVTMPTDETTEQPIPFLIGRLFSVYEQAQFEAIHGNNKLSRRYFDKAMSQPRETMARLTTDYQQRYAPKLGGGARHTFDDIIIEIVEAIGPHAPAARMSGEDACLFCSGYFAEQAARNRRISAAKESKARATEDVPDT